mmetsp:Transcript_2148/g.3968  ORF Transcript_2148/g.3968 Transcript_2148/m.3968 type:complete len:242 (-) Transcript_2148:571-1296(-)
MQILFSVVFVGVLYKRLMAGCQNPATPTPAGLELTKQPFAMSPPPHGLIRPAVHQSRHQHRHRHLQRVHMSHCISSASASGGEVSVESNAMNIGSGNLDYLAVHKSSGTTCCAQDIGHTEPKTHGQNTNTILHTQYSTQKYNNRSSSDHTSITTQQQRTRSCEELYAASGGVISLFQVCRKSSISSFLRATCKVSPPVRVAGTSMNARSSSRRRNITHSQRFRSLPKSASNSSCTRAHEFQ